MDAHISDETLEAVVARYRGLEQQLSTAAGGGEAFVKLSKEYAELGPLIAGIEELRKARGDVAGAEELLADPATDAEMRALAERELFAAKKHLAELETKVKVLLLPKDEADERNAILEV